MFSVLLAIVLIGVLLGVFLLGDSLESSFTGATPRLVPAPRPEGEVVALEIDFGNGVSKTFAALPWHDGMSVAELLEIAEGFRPGIEVLRRGQGEAAFLTAIDGIAHDAPSDRYWTYQINGKLAEAGIARQQIEPNDRVRWTFGVPPSEE